MPYCFAERWPWSCQRAGNSACSYCTGQAFRVPFRYSMVPQEQKAQSPLISLPSMSINVLLLIRNGTVHYDDVDRTTDPACQESARSGSSTPWDSDNFHPSPGVRSARGTFTSPARMRSNSQLLCRVRSRARCGWIGGNWRSRGNGRGRGNRRANRSRPGSFPGTHRVCESEYGYCKRGLGCRIRSRLYFR
jgi:hypothetical protein